jgi:dTDP-4-amino-4,6-dideoxygalactose transaminase
MMSDALQTPIALARPSLDEAEAEAARRAILSGWITQGPEVSAFEKEFAAYVGAAQACAVSSATAALHLALAAVGVGRDDRVVTVSHSFIATANCIRFVGATPVFVDIDATGNIDPMRLDDAAMQGCKAILAVHQLGMPCDLPAILKVAAHHRVPLIEDAACAIGSEIRIDGRWERVGAPHGQIACFSFHPRKLLSTGDGGMLTTNDGAVAARVRRLRQHGMSVNDRERHLAGTSVFETYEELGFNYRMTDIQAAIGRVQLKRIPNLTAERRRLADNYAALLCNQPDIELPIEPDWARSNWQTYQIKLPHGVDQRSTMDAMLGEGVTTRRGVMCAHREKVYETEPWECAGRRPACGCMPGSCLELRASEDAQDRGLMLPLYSGLTEEQQARVVAALRRALEKAVERCQSPSM